MQGPWNATEEACTVQLQRPQLNPPHMGTPHQVDYHPAVSKGHLHSRHAENEAAALKTRAACVAKEIAGLERLLPLTESSGAARQFRARPAAFACGTGGGVFSRSAGGKPAAVQGQTPFTQTPFPSCAALNSHPKKQTPPFKPQMPTLKPPKPLTPITSLPPNPSPPGVFVRVDEANAFLWRALITGPEDTPYSGGCFIFDIYFPGTYPQVGRGVPSTLAGPPSLDRHLWGGGGEFHVGRFGRFEGGSALCRGRFGGGNPGLLPAWPAPS